MHILLIEDEKRIADFVARGLEGSGFSVDVAENGERALAQLAGAAYDLLILDLMLPDVDGLTLLEKIRNRKVSQPVLILSARGSLDDRVKGLDFGADDYLVKPFEIRELLARMRAVLRRQGSGSSTVFSNGRLHLDPATREASFLGEESLLTAREFALLSALLTRPGTILSRSELERQVYGWNEEVESNAVEVHIHALRRKLGADAIRNVRGVGWMIAKPSRGTGA